MHVPTLMINTHMQYRFVNGGSGSVGKDAAC